MKHIITIITISLFCISSEAKDVDAIRIKERGYEGYIFSQSHFVYGLHFDGVKDRITLSEDQIKKAETILKDSIENIIKGRSPNIKNKTLKKYKRQYVGFVNEKGEIVIYMNFLKGLDREQKSKLNKEILWILDGGDNYWQIFINIDKKEWFGLYINGDG